MKWFPTIADTTSTFWLSETAAKNAPSIDWLFNWILWVNIFFTVLIIALMVWFAFRYRKRPGNEDGGVGGHNNALEITWTVIPTIIVVLIYYYGFKGFVHAAAVEPPTAYEITATGRMWNWSFQYPNGFIGNELHVPPNIPVRVVLRSEDVIHDLWVPAFRVKKDAVPGRYNRMWFEADKAGTYDLYCAVYCGQNHSTMRSIAVVHKDLDDFNAWLDDVTDRRGKDSYITIGKHFYETRGCATCHSTTPGVRITGPSWGNMYGSMVPIEPDGHTILADDAYIRESVLEPAAKIHQGFPNVMPSFKGQIKDYELESVIWFMKSISTHVTEEQLKPGTQIVPKPPKAGATTQPAVAAAN